MRWTLLVAGTLLAAPLARADGSDARPTLALLPVMGNAPPDQIDLVDDALRNALVTTGLYRVQDRAAMRHVLEAQAFNQFECDETCEIAQGRILQVSKLVTARVKTAGSDAWISLRLTSVQTGEVEKSAMRPCKSCDAADLVAMAEDIVREVIGTSGVFAFSGPQRPPPTRWNRWYVGFSVGLAANPSILEYEIGGEGQWVFTVGVVALAARWYQNPRGDSWFVSLGLPTNVGYQWILEHGGFLQVGFPPRLMYAW